MRIVSLLPSTTEIVFALGAGDDVVGVTFECDSPEEARTRHIVSTSALPDGLSPAEIDAVVSARLAAGEDLYHLDEGVLRDLAADLVLTQNLCAVCAVDVTTVDSALDYLGCQADVLTIDPRTLSEVIDSIETIGAATGTVSAAQRLVVDLKARLDTVRATVEGAPAVRTALLEWTDPPFAPGHWLPDMVTTAGGIDVLGQAGVDSRRIDWSDVRAATPDVVICAPCGFGLDDASRLAEDVVNAEILDSRVPVWAVDANASFARPGPRVVDGVEAVAAVLHPDIAPPVPSNLARRIR